MIGITIMLMVMTTVMAEVQRITLFGMGLQHKDTIALGHIEFNPEHSKALYLPSRVDSIDGKLYCIGTNDIPNNECFAVSDDISHQQFIIYTHQGEIDYLAIKDIKSSGTNKESNQKVMVSEVPTAPTPNLNPSNKPQRAQPEIKKVTTLKTDEEGNQIEVTTEVEEPEKSFIQKYWTYIVPPLLIIFVLMGDEEKK